MTSFQQRQISNKKHCFLSSQYFQQLFYVRKSKSTTMFFLKPTQLYQFHCGFQKIYAKNCNFVKWMNNFKIIVIQICGTNASHLSRKALYILLCRIAPCVDSLPGSLQSIVLGWLYFGTKSSSSFTMDVFNVGSYSSSNDSANFPPTCFELNRLKEDVRDIFHGWYQRPF